MGLKIPGLEGTMKAFCTFLGLLLISAVLVGLLLGNSEYSNAKADEVRARIAAEERQRQTERELAEQKAEDESEAYRARQARLLELMGPLAAVGSIVALALTGATCYYLVAKARAATAGQAAEGRRTGQRETPPSPAKPGGASNGDRHPSPAQLVRVRPNEISYDSLLAYFHDYVLHPNRPRAFYRTRIAPEVEDIYLAVLTDAQVIVWQTGGHAGWILPHRIKGVDDVRRCIPPRTFYSLVSFG
jgi:hypothetical protein